MVFYCPVIDYIYWYYSNCILALTSVRSSAAYNEMWSSSQSECQCFTDDAAPQSSMPCWLSVDQRCTTYRLHIILLTATYDLRSFYLSCDWCEHAEDKMIGEWESKRQPDNSFSKILHGCVCLSTAEYCFSVKHYSAKSIWKLYGSSRHWMSAWLSCVKHQHWPVNKTNSCRSHYCYCTHNWINSTCFQAVAIDSKYHQ